MKAEFFTDLVVRALDGKKWVLDSELRYGSKILRRIIAVPKGYVTDFASVPRLPLTFALTGNTAHRAAVVHDYLYQTHKSKTRRTADKVFFEAMKVSGVPLWRRSLMYSGVRLGGLFSWLSGPDRYMVLNSKVGH